MSATARQTRYVRVFHRWVSRPAPGHWTGAIGVVDERDGRPDPGDGHSIAVYEVDNVRQAEAVGVVVEWLARGRPTSMAVREITRGRTVVG